MSDPYQSPAAGPESHARHSGLWWGIGSLLVMIALNGCMWLITGDAAETGGYQQIGFPSAFYTYGGENGNEEYWYRGRLIDDTVFAGAVVFVTVYLRKRYVRSQRNRLDGPQPVRKLFIEFVDDESKPPQD